MLTKAAIVLDKTDTLLDKKDALMDAGISALNKMENFFVKGIALVNNLDTLVSSYANAPPTDWQNLVYVAVYNAFNQRPQVITH